jgi:hypothetical protein
LGPAVRGTEHAILGAGIQGGRSLGVDGKTRAIRIGETSFYSNPSGAAVDGTENTILSTGIQDGRGERINGKADLVLIVRGETSVHCCPRGAAICGAEDATGAETSIQCRRGERVDGKIPNVPSIQWQLCPSTCICCICSRYRYHYARKTQDKTQD